MAHLGSALLAGPLEICSLKASARCSLRSQGKVRGRTAGGGPVVGQRGLSDPGRKRGGPLARARPELPAFPTLVCMPVAVTCRCRQVWVRRHPPRRQRQGACVLCWVRICLSVCQSGGGGRGAGHGPCLDPERCVWLQRAGSQSHAHSGSGSVRVCVCDCEHTRVRALPGGRRHGSPQKMP